MSALNKLWAIVPAAGIGARMQSDLPKQYLPLAEKTMIEHTLERLLDCESLTRLVVCLSPNDTQFSTLAVATHSRIGTAIGGDTRAQSVLNGLAAIQADANDDDWVLVHDAARPCLSRQRLQFLLSEVQAESVGGLLAVPVKDTLKQALLDQPFVSKTLDRSLIWQAQTPQMFRFGVLEDSLRRALDAKIEVTDEASAIEWGGHRVKLVEGSSRNIKITTPDDLVLAELLLKAEHEQ